MTPCERIPFGEIDTKGENAAFLAIYTDNISPWKYFNSDISHIECPALIMIDRWDGRSGFPGGTREGDEPLLKTLKREIKEEIGININKGKVHPIVSHKGKITTHLYGMRVIEAEFFHIYYHILNNFSRSIMLHTYEEQYETHFMSEITGIKIVPIVEHQGKGINKFLENSFAGSGKQDLLVMIDEIFAINCPDCKL